MAINYHFDPLGYFTVQKEEPYYRSNIYTRAIKSEYVTKNADNYDAVIIGGSKSGVLSTELLSQYAGKRYYNFYFNKGNFSDYLAGIFQVSGGTYQYFRDHTASERF